MSDFPPENRRLANLYETPMEASPAEIKHMAEELSNFRRARGTKTLRDEFAMAALTGLIAQMGEVRQAADLAREAFLASDAMMEARK